MRWKDAMEIGRLDAHAQAALIAKGEVSACELVEAAIVRTQCVNESLRAVSHQAFELARSRAREKLPATTMAGVPYLLKDSLDYPGMPSRSGSRLMPDTPADYLPAFAERLNEAGLIPIGKSSMPEFGLLPSTEPALYGATVNPWAPDRSAGGSSGGAAAAVAVGIVPVAHASDGGGSIRIPASCCGLFGFKPSRGGNVRARRPSVIEDLLCSDSMLSRSVRDGAWFARKMRPSGWQSASPARQRRPLRIGVVESNLLNRAPDREVTDVIGRSATLCVSLGHDVELLQMHLNGPDVLEAFKTIWGFLARDIVDHCRLWAPSASIDHLLEPWTLALAAWGGKLTPLDLESAIGIVGSLDAVMEGVFAGCDLILSPVLTEPPLPIGRLSPDRPFDDMLREMFEYIAYTPLQNMAGLPSMSVPLYTTASGLPVGSMFTGARDSDELLLEFALDLEKAAPWADRWPTVPASFAGR